MARPGRGVRVVGSNLGAASRPKYRIGKGGVLLVVRVCTALYKDFHNVNTEEDLGASNLYTHVAAILVICSKTNNTLCCSIGVVEETQALFLNRI